MKYNRSYIILGKLIDKWKKEGKKELLIELLNSDFISESQFASFYGEGWENEIDEDRIEIVKKEI